MSPENSDRRRVVPRRRSGRSSVVALVILSFWITMTSVHLHWILWPPRLPPSSVHGVETFLQGASHRETWLGIYHGDHKLGYSYTAITRAPQGGGYIINNLTILEVLALGETATMRFEATMELDAEFRTQKLHLDLAASDHHLKAEAVARDGGLAITVTSGGHTSEQFLPLEDGRMTLSNSVGPLLDVHDLEPGVEYVLDIFDPLTMTPSTATVRKLGSEVITVAGQTYNAHRIEVRWQDSPFTSWISDQGELLRQDTPLGWRLEREPRAIAQALDRTGVRDLAVEMAVKPTGNAMVSQPRDCRRLRLRISGVNPAKLDLDGGQQTLLDATTGLVEILRPPQSISVTDAGFRANAPPSRYLESTPFISANAPAIRAAAQQVVGATSDPLAVAEMLSDWVHRNLAKQITFSLPSALEVLANRSGDCNEHTTLFVALARARGIPARPVVGLVWHQGAFYYHAWPEVWVAGRWLAMDPTFGQSRADAARLRLLAGDLARQMQVASLMGKVRLEIVEAE